MMAAEMSVIADQYDGSKLSVFGVVRIGLTSLTLLEAGDTTRTAAEVFSDMAHTIVAVLNVASPG